MTQVISVGLNRTEIEELLLTLREREAALDERVRTVDDGASHREIQHHQIIVHSLVELLGDSLVLAQKAEADAIENREPPGQEAVFRKCIDCKKFAKRGVFTRTGFRCATCATLYIRRG